MTVYRDMSRRSMTMILVATAMAGATLPAVGAWACGPYGPPPEAPRPEHEQTWLCHAAPRVDASGEHVVDMMRLATRGGEDALWKVTTVTVAAEDASLHTLTGFVGDFGLASWTPETLRIQMYGRSVVVVPSPWNPAAVSAELRNESGKTRVVSTFRCTLRS